MTVLPPAHAYRFTKPIKRIAIIGAGAAGLATAKSLVSQQHFAEIKIFERNSRIGGTWIYSDKKGPKVYFPSVDPLIADPEAPPRHYNSSIYSTLRTNLPHPVMSFKNHPFPEDTPLFPSHSHVLENLEAFAEENKLLPLVTFNTIVQHMDYLDEEWKLTLLTEGEISTEAFDAVIVCSGHYYVPFIPNINGLDELSEKRPDKLLHSREYKKPEDFKGKVVLVVGGASSAIDIARDLSFQCKNVYQSIREKEGSADIGEAPGTGSASDNRIEIKPEMKLIDVANNKIHFVDGTQLDIPDIILFATGYLYSYPFLSQFERTNTKVEEEEVIITDGMKVHNVYEQIFYIPNPTLAFIGLPVKVVPFPLFQYQSTYVAQVFAGKTDLPGRKEMREWYQRLTELAPGRDGHILKGPKEVEYCNRLSDLTNGAISRVPEWWFEMRTKALSLRKKELGY
ncbi:FAD/NAD(P)-binding domain-containing protein [Basidiobolus meristosporus CBS 931.73]|uniref:FAD/NAD(P)-binding domain-containing protein n=1 Tax=Basidiobolus meristosporus CBS 931.73 TaxID=1314790 RepID=A0A1Y1XZ11_9FUNG|nr:FAD/NAD(P)-binding domain-containing protein [Basidiobolus meristosporus CBS 931.73]|eukprot:ORX91003.1 FAD/NAD(P)-binding domain-containing protein [Basidiobolus meristosporus CBS 931.73]